MNENDFNEFASPKEKGLGNLALPLLPFTLGVGPLLIAFFIINMENMFFNAMVAVPLLLLGQLTALAGFVLGVFFCVFFWRERWGFLWSLVGTMASLGAILVEWKLLNRQWD